MLLNKLSTSIVFVVLLTPLLLCAAEQQVLRPGTGNHPCLAYQTREVPKAYGTTRFGFSAKANINDLTFVQPFQSKSSLTHEERYMLAGLKSGPRNSGEMPSWCSDLFTVIGAYYDKHGVIPPQLSEDIVAELFGGRDVSNLAFHFIRSPITGDYPRLDAKEFSPGNVYMRPLTAAELDHFCEFDAVLAGIVRNGTVRGADREAKPAKLLGPVFYLRVYGYTSVIENTIQYSWTELE